MAALSTAGFRRLPSSADCSVKYRWLDFRLCGDGLQGHRDDWLARLPQRVSKGACSVLLVEDPGCLARSAPYCGGVAATRVFWRGVVEVKTPRHGIEGSRGSSGFTLLELLVVIVIIGLLAAYVGPRYFSQLGKSERGAAKAQIEALARALDAYRLDTRRYPTTEQGLGALVNRPGDEGQWNGPYLQKEVPPDPWGNAYIYRSPGAVYDFELFSYGADGRSGGEDGDADISYR